MINTGDTFDNVVFSNESSISLEQFCQTCYRKIDEPAKRKPRPKHPLKLHVWAGISRHRATKICIFEGIMEASLYCSILESTLIPFLHDTLPNHRFMQDNDPKHMSRVAKAFEENEINSWGTPPPEITFARYCTCSVINPLTPVLAVTGCDEPWPFFHS